LPAALLSVFAWGLVAATGTYGKPDPGSEVEVKCLVPTEQIVAVTARLDFKEAKPERRVVCFYDTDSRAFSPRPKIILRSRYNLSGEKSRAASTVKVCGGDPGLADAEDEAECEYDRVVNGGPRGFLAPWKTCAGCRRYRESDGSGKIGSIFGAEQKAFLRRAYGALDWQKLRAFGPVNDVQVW
jgi:hypothetical protein